MTNDRSPRRVALLVAAPLAALVLAWWATREPTTDDATAAHDHAAMTAAATDTSHVVSLSADEARRIGVTFAVVTAGALPREIRAVGQVVVDETRLHAIAPKVDGWVERLHVDYTGQAVRAGEPLLDLYSPMVVSAQEELLLALRLATDVSSGSPEARGEAADLVASARRRLAWWDVPADEIARLESTGVVNRTITLRAPRNGVVLEKSVVAGQRIMAGEALYRLADLSTLWIEGEIHEQDLAAVRVGQSATAHFDAFADAEWRGVVAYIHPTLAPETRTVRIRVVIANADRRLRPGMFATLDLTIAGRSGSLSIPRSAVLATGARNLVFVRLADGRLKPRAVRLGTVTTERVEVLSGLAVGDTVVASATFLVDAESSLGTALGGMGAMPGMEITIPPDAKAKRPKE